MSNLLTVSYFSIKLVLRDEMESGILNSETQNTQQVSSSEQVFPNQESSLEKYNLSWVLKA